MKWTIMTCTECNGSGVYVGFTAREECRECGGTGGDVERCPSAYEIVAAAELSVGDEFFCGREEFSCVGRHHIGSNILVVGSIFDGIDFQWRIFNPELMVKRRKKAQA